MIANNFHFVQNEIMNGHKLPKRKYNDQVMSLSGKAARNTISAASSGACATLAVSGWEFLTHPRHQLPGTVRCAATRYHGHVLGDIYSFV